MCIRAPRDLGLRLDPAKTTVLLCFFRSLLLLPLIPYRFSPFSSLTQLGVWTLKDIVDLLIGLKQAAKRVRLAQDFLCNYVISRNKNS